MLGNLTPTDILYDLITIVIGLSIHEAMHAFVAFRLGDTTAEDMGRLSLNPLKHIDPLTTLALPAVTLILFHIPILAAKPVPFNPDRVKYDEFGGALIAAAGPFANLALAVIGALLLHLNLQGINNFLVTFVQLNVIMFVFNLIPIPPLDGSRILYAFAPEPLQDFMRSIEPFGLLIILTVVLLGGFDGVLINIYQEVFNLLPLPRV